MAHDLLGTYLIRRSGRSLLAGRIVEVEAYLGSRDPASHSFRGRTPRNDVMFRGGGRLYVYFTYGMHFCANVVTGPEGLGHAVLLRAAEPVRGTEVMARRRGKRGTKDLRLLCAGPARLCQSFGIGRRENGTDLCGDRIWIARDPRAVRSRVSATTRVGISAGREQRWRFLLAGSPFVSPAVPVRR